MHRNNINPTDENINPVDQFFKLLKAWDPKKIDVAATAKISHCFLQLFSKEDHGKINPAYREKLLKQFQTAVSPQDIAKIPSLFQLYVVNFITKNGFNQFTQDMNLTYWKNAKASEKGKMEVSTHRIFDLTQTSHQDEEPKASPMPHRRK